MLADVQKNAIQLRASVLIGVKSRIGMDHPPLLSVDSAELCRFMVARVPSVGSNGPRSVRNGQSPSVDPSCELPAHLRYLCRTIRLRLGCDGRASWQYLAEKSLSCTFLHEVPENTGQAFLWSSWDGYVMRLV